MLHLLDFISLKTIIIGRFLQCIYKLFVVFKGIFNLSLVLTMTIIRKSTVDEIAIRIKFVGILKVLFDSVGCLSCLCPFCNDDNSKCRIEIHMHICIWLKQIYITHSKKVSLCWLGLVVAIDYISCLTFVDPTDLTRLPCSISSLTSSIPWTRASRNLFFLLYLQPFLLCMNDMF